MSRLPNVLWIFVDQLRYHALSCYGDSNLQTPNLDRLCREGISFTNAMSPCPVCTPARGALMTGQYCNKTDILYLGDLIDPSQRTAAHVFKEAGYQTSYVGKWHLSSQQNPFGHNEGAEYWVHPKLRGGFEDWMGFELSNHFWKTRYCTDGKMWPPKIIEGYQTDGLTDLSLDYLGRVSHVEQPWFHVLSYEAPHHGADQEGIASVTVGDITHTRHPAPPEYECRFKDKQLSLRENVPASHEAASQSMLSQYYAMIQNLDDNIGRVLDWLDESGLSDNTLVCFFSDHGEMGGSHGRFQKTVHFEESIRVPLMLRWPGVIPEDTTLSDPASLVDLLPTCRGLCGIFGPDTFQGLDFSGRILNRLTEPLRDGVLIQWFGNPRYFPDSVKDPHWRAIRAETEAYAVYADGSVYLYDLQKDPYQRTNLADDPACAGLRKRLHRLLVEEIIRQEGVLPAYIGRDPS